MVPLSDDPIMFIVPHLSSFLMALMAIFRGRGWRVKGNKRRKKTVKTVKIKGLSWSRRGLWLSKTKTVIKAF